MKEIKKTILFRETKKAESHEPLYAPDVNTGITLLNQRANQLKQTKDSVVIAVVGRPNSGKSFFIRKFLELHDGYNKNHAPSAIGILHPYEQREWDDTKGSDFILIHDVSIDGIDREVQEHGHTLDIKVYIFNPTVALHFDKRVDIVVENKDSKSKGSF